MSVDQRRKVDNLFSNLETISHKVNLIYLQTIEDYHLEDHIDAPMPSPYLPQQVEHLFYQKCWIDTVQWHLEDEIRAYDIDPVLALRLKRRIDAYNQARTNIVEIIDSRILKEFENVTVMKQARVNTESPAWALDRLSILALKIYHMNLEVKREKAEAGHVKKCFQKLQVLNEQQKTLSKSINELFQDISQGLKFMKVYKQMKMYNDASLNPVLYNRS